MHNGSNCPTSYHQRQPLRLSSFSSSNTASQGSIAASSDVSGAKSTSSTPKSGTDTTAPAGSHVQSPKLQIPPAIAAAATGIGAAAASAGKATVKQVKDHLFEPAVIMSHESHGTKQVVDVCSRKTPIKSLCCLQLDMRKPYALSWLILILVVLLHYGNMTQVSKVLRLIQQTSVLQAAHLQLSSLWQSHSTAITMLGAAAATAGLSQITIAAAGLFTDVSTTEALLTCTAVSAAAVGGVGLQLRSGLVVDPERVYQVSSPSSQPCTHVICYRLLLYCVWVGGHCLPPYLYSSRHAVVDNHCRELSSEWPSSGCDKTEYTPQLQPAWPYQIAPCICQDGVAIIAACAAVLLLLSGCPAQVDQPCWLAGSDGHTSSG